MIHFDVRDGCFVPTISIGSCFIEAVETTLLKDVQLLIHDPSEKVVDFVQAGADIITLHIESDYNLLDTLKMLGQTKCKNDPEHHIMRGIAMNPEIPVEDLAPFINEVEMVTVMAYNPKIRDGFKDEHLADRVEKIKKIVSHSKKDILITINGNISHDNIQQIAALKPDVIVCGKPVFEEGNLKTNLQALLKEIQ